MPNQFYKPTPPEGWRAGALNVAAFPPTLKNNFGGQVCGYKVAL